MKKYVDVSNFPLCLSLIDNYEKIKEEFYKISNFTFEKPNNILPKAHGSSRGKLLYRGDFTCVYSRISKETLSIHEYNSLFGNDDRIVTQESESQAIEKLRKVQKETPVIESCIAPYIDHIGNVGFNTIFPGAVLNRHYGMTKRFIRIHLGIECDLKAVFYVEKLTPRPWEDGKIFAFSDGDVFHGTAHTGSKNRTILTIDVDKSIIGELKEDNWV
jgi:hypothetical protein